MSFLTNVKNFVTAASLKIYNVLIAILGKDGVDVLANMLKAAEKDGLTKIVADAVVAVSTLSIGSDAKKAEAFKMILTDAEAMVKTYGTSTVNLLIELAVKRLKTVAPAK